MKKGEEEEREKDRSRERKKEGSKGRGNEEGSTTQLPNVNVDK